ncbi:MAG TPA: SDR family oxidoreductase [Anaerolineae bacterium]|nr:SDR family oxidoreductase [Anaerolineae bacterium]
MKNEFTEADWERCTEILQAIAQEPGLIDERERVRTLIAKINRQGRKRARRLEREAIQEHDQRIIGEVIAQREPLTYKGLAAGLPDTDEKRILRSPRMCYVCKERYQELHFFYHYLCPECAEVHFAKRYQGCDLTGRVAVLTGGRVKIGYQTGLSCLRNGAKLYVTTRFPADGLRRYQMEPDFDEWGHRLFLYGLDLRHVRGIYEFVAYLEEREESVDILINNAAQTVKRPLSFYQHLLAPPEDENAPQLVQGDVDLLELKREDIPLLGTLDRLFPEGELDVDGQQIDKRAVTSWMLSLSEVGLVEMLEVQLVNMVAPFILCGQLKPLFLRSSFERKFMINVSAMEGQFSRINKTHYHPHTNMAKAALNMLTRTSAGEYAEDGIYMNSVDTGWVTDESPWPKQQRLAEEGFHPPLDIVDGMARIMDPIYTGITSEEEPIYGKFLKDYVVYPW